jgi:hypothetical protein
MPGCIAATCAAVQADGGVDARDAARVRRRVAAVEISKVLRLAVELAVLAVARAGEIGVAAGVGGEVVRVGPDGRTSGVVAVAASDVAVGVAPRRAPDAPMWSTEAAHARRRARAAPSARLCPALALAQTL